MRLLTKAEACQVLAVSLSTLDRRIASGELLTRREPRGRRHRVYVMLDDDPPENGKAADSALAVALERIRGLEGQVAYLQGQLEWEQQRNAELVNQMKAGQTSTAQDERGLWRRFWQS